MKRLIAILFVLVNSLAIFAQKDVTKFLGFPIDGTISEMKAKLKTKGFKPISSSDELEGEFNGFKAYVMPMENKGKVWRICVINQTPTNETDIRIRFNDLVRQFSKNTKYLPLRKINTLVRTRISRLICKSNTSDMKRISHNCHQIPL